MSNVIEMKRNENSWAAFSKSRERAAAVAAVPVAELVRMRRERENARKSFQPVGKENFSIDYREAVCA